MSDIHTWILFVGLITLVGAVFVAVKLWVVRLMLPKKLELPPIDVDTILYVDEFCGSDSNDGTSWEQARKTVDGLPKQLNAELTIRLRKDPWTHCNLSGFYGVGKLMFQGELPPKINPIRPGEDNEGL